MWAGSVLLRIGEQRDVLVAVRADTESALDRLRTLFEPWLEPDFADQPSFARPAFSVRLQPVPDRGATSSSGAKPVPQLCYGPAVIARSRQPDDILRALAQVLGGVHLERSNDGRIWIGMRPFVRGELAVLVDAARPTLVNDRQLAGAGIEELAAWSVAIEPDCTVAVPPALARLAWDAVGVEPSAEQWQQFDLAGIVALHGHDHGHDYEVTQDALVADIRRHSFRARWFDQVASLAEAGRVVLAGDHASLRAQTRALIGDAEGHGT